MNITTTPTVGTFGGSAERAVGLAEGVAARDAAHALLSARRGDVVRLGQRALIQALLLADVATADDVREAFEVPAGVDPVCLGAVPGPLARAGIIRRDGWEPTTRPAGHARPVSRWRLLDRSAAVGWLMSHPPPQKKPATPKDDPASCGAGPTLFSH